MKKLKLFIGIFILVSIAIVISRSIFIDYVIIGNDKFSPDLKKGDFNFVCKFCKDFESGDYVVIDTGRSNSYKVVKIENFADESKVNIFDGQNKVEIKKENIIGSIL